MTLAHHIIINTHQIKRGCHRIIRVCHHIKNILHYIKTHTYDKLKCTHYKNGISANQSVYNDICVAQIKVWTAHKKFSASYKWTTYHQTALTFHTAKSQFTKKWIVVSFNQNTIFIYIHVRFFTFDAGEKVPSYVVFLAFDTFFFRVV